MGVHILLVGVPPVHQGVALQGQPKLLADLLGLSVCPRHAGRQELQDLVLLVELAEVGPVCLASGIELLYCWQDTMCILFYVIHAVQDILTSDLNMRTESESAQGELDIGFFLN